MSIKRNEFFCFDRAAYLAKLRTLTADNLWELERRNDEKWHVNRAEVAFCSILFPFVHGLSLPPLIYVGRKLRLATKKGKMICDELERRHLPNRKLLSEKTSEPGDGISLVATASMNKPLLGGARKGPFVLVGASGQPISQVINAEQPLRCRKDATSSRACNFCLGGIDPAGDVYYHCCDCSPHNESAGCDYDICEPCVGEMGCSCPHRREHVLHRLGEVGSGFDNIDESEEESVYKTMSGEERI